MEVFRIRLADQTAVESFAERHFQELAERMERVPEGGRRSTTDRMHM